MTERERKLSLPQVMPQGELEANPHANGMSTVDSKVHAQVIYKLQHVSLTNCLITVLSRSSDQPAPTLGNMCNTLLNNNYTVHPHYCFTYTNMP